MIKQYWILNCVQSNEVEHEKPGPDWDGEYTHVISAPEILAAIDKLGEMHDNYDWSQAKREGYGPLFDEIKKLCALTKGME